MLINNKKSNCDSKVCTPKMLKLQIVNIKLIEKYKYLIYCIKWVILLMF